MVATRPGARASGGPVDAKIPYWVGEEGPEIFVPDQSGTIMPTGSWTGAGTSAGYAGGGSPAEVVIQLDGREVARYVDRRLYVALGSAGGSQIRR